MPSEPIRAVLLLSGGLDSATAGAMSRADGRELFALSFRYGQRHNVELERAQLLGEWLGVKRHVIIDFDLRAFGGSALTDDLPVPKSAASSNHEIPVTYVPARNTIFLSFALGWAEVLEAGEIVIGVNAVDYSGYPDCRPEYIDAYQNMADLATRAGVEGTHRILIRTPLMNLSKAEIIARGVELGLDYAMTVSCYDPLDDGLACGECDACTLRRAGFQDAGIDDPTRYS
ncbi:MAG: 7-cyano-7-deazaguanine synthase QueC [Pseudomonadota bacterium]